MTRSQATPASSQIIALEGMVQRLEQQVAAQQARIAELREALHYTLQAWHYDGISDEHGSTYAESDRRCDKPDNLSALEEAKRQARREALVEAAKLVREKIAFRLSEGSPYRERAHDVVDELRRMAGEVK